MTEDAPGSALPRWPRRPLLPHPFGDMDGLAYEGTGATRRGGVSGYVHYFRGYGCREARMRGAPCVFRTCQEEPSVTAEFRDFPHQGRAGWVVVRLTPMRCGKDFVREEWPNSLSIGWRATMPLLQHLGRLCLTTTLSDVVRRTHVGRGFVTAFSRDLIDSLDRAPLPPVPEIIAIDDSIRNPNRYMAVVDAIHGTAVDLRAGACSKVYQAWQDSRVGADTVRAVFMDANGESRSTIRKANSGALIGLDRFHALKRVKKAHLAVRTHLTSIPRRFLSTKSFGAYEATNRLIVAHPASLSEYNEARLQKKLDDYPLLRKSTDVYRGFLSLYEISGVAQVEAALHRWAASVPSELDGFYGSVINLLLRAWHKEFLLYFETGLTSNVVENHNLFTKMRVAMEFGPVPAPVLRLFFLFRGNGLPESTVTQRIESLGRAGPSNGRAE